MTDVSPQLLNSSRAEGITGGDENTMVVFEQPEGDLSKVGGLANTIHATEGDNKWPTSSFGQHHFTENINSTFWTQDLNERFFHRFSNSGLNTCRCCVW